MEDDPLRSERGFIPKKVAEQAQKVRSRMSESAERFEVRNRVGTGTIILMLSVAGLYDLAQFLLNFIPILGWILTFIIGIYAWLTFYVWTSAVGWNAVDTGLKAGLKQFLKFTTRYILPFIGVIPILNDLPEITTGVLLSIMIMKSEDFIYNKTKGAIDEQVIKEGIQFFNIFRNTYDV